MESKSSHTTHIYAKPHKQTTIRLSLSLFLTLAFVIVEAGAGIFANSLALLTDAAHNLTDVIALGLTWFAVRITSQPANAQKTYGYHRAGILVALLNSTTLGAYLAWHFLRSLSVALWIRLKCNQVFLLASV